jgi:hypothetical protein
MSIPSDGQEDPSQPSLRGFAQLARLGAFDVDWVNAINRPEPS